MCEQAGKEMRGSPAHDSLRQVLDATWYVYPEFPAE